MATMSSMHQLIVRDPGIHGGEPVIRGTRVPILSLHEDYPGDLPAVAAAYRVSPAAVEAALAYYRAHQAEIDRLIEQHERAAQGR
jgi:uncharacterized protein (DUF433 family)